MMKTVSVIPIFMRIAPSFMKIMTRTAAPADWVVVVDGFLDLARKVPEAAVWIDNLRPWIEKLKEVVPQLISANVVPVGVKTEDVLTAGEIVKLHDAIMSKLVQEGLMAQAAVNEESALDQV